MSPDAMVGLRAHVGGLRSPRATRPAAVISGNTRSYEVIGQAPGRAGIILARQHGELGFSKLVAIRTIPSHEAEIVRALVIDEARLRHANIVSTLDVLVAGDQLHIVMEYVEGPCLADVIAASTGGGKRLPVAASVAIVHDLLLGLEHAHGAHDESIGLGSMVHCDVAPRNVLVGFDGLTRILDVGIARTQQGSGGDDSGKAGYLAPEQIAGGMVDRTVDIYACGVVLYELLTAARFDAQRENADPRPGARVRGITAELDAIVFRATATDPRDRYLTAGAMAKALSHAMELATRTEVGDAVRALVAKTPSSGIRMIDDVSPDASGPVVKAGRRLRFPSFASLAQHSLLRQAIRWFPRSLRPSAWWPQLSFATRLLLVFSAVLVFVLAVVAGRARSPKRPLAPVAPASTVPFGPPPPPTLAEPATIEVDAIPATSASPAAASAAPAKAGRHKPDAKPSAKPKH